MLCGDLEWWEGGVGRRLKRRGFQWYPTPVLLPGKSMDGGAW